jgi:hypothetical protein
MGQEDPHQRPEHRGEARLLPLPARPVPRERPAEQEARLMKRVQQPQNVPPEQHGRQVQARRRACSFEHQVPAPQPSACDRASESLIDQAVQRGVA